MSAESRHLFVIVLTLLVLGLAFLFSASAVTSAEGRAGDPYVFLKKQLLWSGIAMLGLAACYRMPTEFWERRGFLLLLATAVLLALCYVPGVGAQINGARRWLKLGGWFVQPSEIAKLTLAMAVCAYAARDPERLKEFRRGFVPAFGMIAVTCALVVKEPDLGTAVFLGLVSTLTLVVAGVRMRHLVPVGGGLAAAGGLYVATHFEHVMERIRTWLHPEQDPFGAGHQIKQSLVALGAGSWFGEGLGRGQGKLFYLPEVHSDFILPLVGEELGFLGTGAVVILFAALAIAGWRIAHRARTPFGGLLAFSLTLTIALQAAMNVAVVTASMPTKGIPLPFLSAGGSSLLFTMCGIGILMKIGKTGGPECESSSRAEGPEVTSSRELPSPSMS